MHQTNRGYVFAKPADRDVTLLRGQAKKDLKAVFSLYGLSPEVEKETDDQQMMVEDKGESEVATNYRCQGAKRSARSSVSTESMRSGVGNKKAADGDEHTHTPLFPPSPAVRALYGH